MTDTLEAPTQTQDYSPEQANSVFAPISQEVAAKRPQTPDTQKAPETGKTAQNASEAGKTQGNANLESAAAPEKKGLKIGSVKKPEEPKAEEKKDGQVQDSKAGEKPENEGVKTLREFYQKHKGLPEEYDKFKGEFETTKEELKKLKALGLNEQEREEFQRYRSMNAVEAVKQSQDYKAKILAPIQTRIGKLQSIAQNAKLDPSKVNALLDAVDISDDFQRNKAIRQLIRGIGNEETDLPAEDYQALADSAISLATDLNDNWYPKQDEALGKAEEIQNAARAQESKRGQEMSQKQAQELERASKQTYEELKNLHLKEIFDEKDLSVEGTTIEQALQDVAPATTPHEMAQRDQLAAALPFVIEYANRALAKVAELERANAKRNGTSPKLGDGAPKEQAAQEQQLDANAVFKGRGKNYFG